MIDLTDDIVSMVRQDVEALYARHAVDVPFHGWHHVRFVASKTIVFAVELGADVRLAELAALVHDLNYLVDPTTSADAGADLRRRILGAAGIDLERIDALEAIVIEAETGSRDGSISVEAKALSDADTLFKALPITPVVLAPLYLRETGRSIRELAEGIVRDQIPLNISGIYFYSASAREKYSSWGGANLQLWQCILECLDDPDVADLLQRIPQA